MSYTVRFCNVNDQFLRYLIVCVDKTWGTSGCQPWTGDWVVLEPITPGSCITSPSFRPTRVLTAITSSDGGYYYTVEFLSQGRVVKRCDRVDRYNPCYLYVTEPPPPTPTQPPPSPPPTPTQPPPSPPPTPTQPPPSPTPTPAPSWNWLIIAILIALLVVLILALVLLLRKK